MARTRKHKITHFYGREHPAVKKMTRRQYRKAVKQRIREGEVDALPIKKSTQGWLTW